MIENRPAEVHLNEFKMNKRIKACCWAIQATWTPATERQRRDGRPFGEVEVAESKVMISRSCLTSKLNQEDFQES